MSNSKASESRAGVLKSEVGVLGSPGLFNSRGFLLSDLSDWWDKRPVRASEAQTLYARQLFSQTKVIF